MRKLTDEQVESFRAYAEANRTETDGTESQWAAYTIMALDELTAFREAALSAAFDDEEPPGLHEHDLPHPSLPVGQR